MGKKKRSDFHCVHYMTELQKKKKKLLCFFYMSIMEAQNMAQNVRYNRISSKTVSSAWEDTVFIF